jgi:hypothetical protein
VHLIFGKNKFWYLLDTDRYGYQYLLLLSYFITSEKFTAVCTYLMEIIRVKVYKFWAKCLVADATQRAPRAEQLPCEQTCIMNFDSKTCDS